MLTFSCFIILAFCLLNIEPIAIEGPAMTRYDPCGLGVIHYDRITEKVWKGVLNLDLYRNLIEVEIEIHYKNKVKVYGTSQNATMFTNNDWREFVIKPKGYPPKHYTFYLNVEDLKENETDVPTVTKFALNNVILCDDNIKVAQTVESLNLSKETDKYHKQVCGRGALDNTELVSVKTEAKPGDWPWHVAIFVKDPVSNKTSYYCGGNIISRTAILTAGHCVDMQGVKIPSNRITVVAGTSNHTDVSQLGRQVLTATEVVLHPSYDVKLATADLAIIRVNRFTYTPYVQPICVSGPVYDKNELIGRQATAIGFGHDKDNKPSNVLRSAYLMVQNDTTCLTFSPAVYTKLLNEFTICAGYGPTSVTIPRNGDSGGGLVVPVMQTDHKVSWFLRGVLSKCGVSPGHFECDPHFYVVYTDVGPHYGWIYHHSGLHFTANIV